MKNQRERKKKKQNMVVELLISSKWLSHLGFRGFIRRRRRRRRRRREGNEEMRITVGLGAEVLTENFVMRKQKGHLRGTDSLHYFNQFLLAIN